MQCKKVCVLSMKRRFAKYMQVKMHIDILYDSTVLSKILGT